MKIKLNNARISFPSLWSHSKYQGESTGKYDCTLVLDNVANAADIKKLNAEIARLTKESFKGKKLSSDKICLKDADEEHFPNSMSIKASNKTRPTIIDKDKSQLTEDDGVIYAGCYVNAVVDLWAQSSGFGKRINASLMGVQFNKKGEAFGAVKTASVDDFDVVEDDDEDLNDVF